MDIQYFIKLQPGFDQFSEAHIDAFSRMLNVAIYPARHTFTSRGESGHAVSLIMEGAVSLQDHADPAVVTSDRILRVGEWFGLLSLVEGLPAFDTCTTSDTVTVASFNRAQFEDLWEAAPPIGLHLLYMLSKQLARTLIVQNKRITARQNAAKR